MIILLILLVFVYGVEVTVRFMFTSFLLKNYDMLWVTLSFIFIIAVEGIGILVTSLWSLFFVLVLKVRFSFFRGFGIGFEAGILCFGICLVCPICFRFIAVISTI